MKVAHISVSWESLSATLFSILIFGIKLCEDPMSLATTFDCPMWLSLTQLSNPQSYSGFLLAVSNNHQQYKWMFVIYLCVIKTYICFFFFEFNNILINNLLTCTCICIPDLYLFSLKYLSYQEKLRDKQHISFLKVYVLNILKFSGTRGLFFSMLMKYRGIDVSQVTVLWELK